MPQQESPEKVGAEKVAAAVDPEVMNYFSSQTSYYRGLERQERENFEKKRTVNMSGWEKYQQEADFFARIYGQLQRGETDDAADFLFNKRLEHAREANRLKKELEGDFSDDQEATRAKEEWQQLATAKAVVQQSGKNLPLAVESLERMRISAQNRYEYTERGRREKGHRYHVEQQQRFDGLYGKITS
ncbi:MAG: hypothetical protein FJ044_01680 [Candidatus Cloacimonetes bacterium]|nr:hypothetical protein [Candidatus Cloacimonadota bacterium]